MQLSISDHLFLLESLPKYGEWVCKLSNRWAFQGIPSSYTLSGLASQLSESLPFLGSYLVSKIVYNIWDLLWCVVIYKLIKIMPGKF